MSVLARRRLLSWTSLALFAASWLWGGCGPRGAPSVPTPAVRAGAASATRFETSRLIPQLEAARGPGRGPYRIMGRREEQASVKVLKAWLMGTRAAPPQAFVRFPWGERGAQLWSAVEGGGAYVFRRRALSPVVVEVPHSFSDLKTFAIGLELYLRLSAKALLVSGTQRRTGCAEEAQFCLSDVAHARTSAFHAVHRALIEGHPDRLVVAVHGFAERKGDPLVVLSASKSRLALSGLAARLAQVLSAYSLRPVATFPDEIDRLGGTTGTQAKHTASASARFMHLELSRDLREALVKSPALMSAFANAVAPEARPP